MTLSLLLFLGVSLATATDGSDDLQKILTRLYSDAAGHSSSCSTATHYAATMRDDGGWSDIDYKVCERARYTHKRAHKRIQAHAHTSPHKRTHVHKNAHGNNTACTAQDRGRANWSPVYHWDRLLIMAQALHLRQCGEAGGKAALLPKIVSGMEFWKANNPLCLNWWFNDFGVPMTLDKFLVIMANTTSANGGAALPQELFDYGLVLLSRGSDPMWHPPPKPRGGPYTGANLVWSLQIDVQRGALAGNASLVGHAFSRMWESLVVSPQAGDGIMADGSFHQVRE